jgi:hypothetical protein
MVCRDELVTETGPLEEAEAVLADKSSLTWRLSNRAETAVARSTVVISIECIVVEKSVRKSSGLQEEEEAKQRSPSAEDGTSLN